MKNIPPMIVPLSERKDLAPVCAAWSYSEWGCHLSGRSLEQVIRSYQKRAENKINMPLAWVCLVEDKPAGMISLKLDDHPDRKDLFPWLASLFVHPSFRNNGIAKNLFQPVMHEAKKLGYKKLYLFTETAQNLYAKLGFRQIGTVADPRGINPHGDILMEIDLL
jgi:N-acetylglutamate synthase-like GNAT family acetyltransferase